MNYSENDSMCCVDFFKSTGKWYMTEAIDFAEYYNELNFSKNFKSFLEAKLGGRCRGTFAICLEPYNKTEYPIGCQL